MVKIYIIKIYLFIVTQDCFEKVNIIGIGTFSEVWHVIDKKYKKEFAMKLILKSKIIDKKFIKGIIKERNLLSKLNHSFLVNMHFSFQDNQYLYIILDLMKGGDLRYYYKLSNSDDIHNNKKFTEKECHFMVSNLILALEYIHKNNIVHCDIKPENIVINKNGYFCLTDFGISINLKNEEKNKKNNYIEGSLGYMAPEIMFQEKISFGVDYFSLGVVCYEMMMGRLPYFATGIEEIKKLILANQVTIKKFDIPVGWSKEAADFINKLIQRKAYKRLGYNNYEEIKNHIWLNNVDWKKIYLHEVKSPFVPDLNKKNFDNVYFNEKKKEIEDSKLTMERYIMIESNKDFKIKFDDFYYFNRYTMKDKDSDKIVNPHIIYEDKDNYSNNANNSKLSRNRNNINKHRYCLTSNI